MGTLLHVHLQYVSMGIYRHEVGMLKSQTILFSNYTYVNFYYHIYFFFLLVHKAYFVHLQYDFIGNQKSKSKVTSFFLPQAIRNVQMQYERFESGKLTISNLSISKILQNCQIDWPDELGMAGQ